MVSKEVCAEQGESSAQTSGKVVATLHHGVIALHSTGAEALTSARQRQLPLLKSGTITRA
jgi:hypothetical protein